MKKLVLMALACSAFIVTSCGSDDNTPVTDKPIVENPGGGEEEVKVTAEWEPATVKLNMVIPLPGVPTSMPYPHTQGCTKDYLQLKSNNTAKFFRYEGTDCKETIYDQAFVRNGNNVTLKVMEYTISGVVKSETATAMVIESDFSQYEALIGVLYPEYKDYLKLLAGSKVELQLTKK